MALDSAQRRGQGDVLVPRVLLGGGLHPAVGEQAVDERLALGALEGPDADAQALAQLVDHPVRGMRHEEAQRGRQHVLVEGPDGERRHEDEKPGRDRDAVAHRPASSDRTSLTAASTCSRAVSSSIMPMSIASRNNKGSSVPPRISASMPCCSLIFRAMAM